MKNLFEQIGKSPPKNIPLAERLRPKLIENFIGQPQLLSEGAPLNTMIENNTLRSIILWGPPGVGKTTLAHLLAQQSELHFEQISAVFSGVSDLKKIFDAAQIRAQNGGGTFLFVDEIHRFNKSQQDGFLPHMENGNILLVGATTENPSFELNAALLSRAQVMVLEPLSVSDLKELLERAEKNLGISLPLDADSREFLFLLADGDGRALLNFVEQVVGFSKEKSLSVEDLRCRLSRKATLYDKNGTQHYNLISALHKSIRGSDPDASIYWLARMLDGGEDPKYLARRILRIAYEDIGLADPKAPGFCLHAWETYERLGSPEGELALAQVVLYLALAPKSNASYKAFESSLEKARISGAELPPKHILNAPNDLMKKQGFGEGYLYDHDLENGFSGQNYFPEAMSRPTFYIPIERGFERDLLKRLEFFKRLRNRGN